MECYAGSKHDLRSALLEIEIGPLEWSLWEKS